MDFDLRRGLRDLGAAHTWEGQLPVDALVARVHRRQTVRACAVGVVGAGAASALVFGGVAAANRQPHPPSVPVASPTWSTTANATPSPSPVPTPAASSTATQAPTASHTPSPPTPAASLVLHENGQITDFPQNPPEADVVSYLTSVLGAAPRVVDAELACAPDGVPGRSLAWGDLGLLVRTTSDSGETVAPYVAGWLLASGGPATMNLATAAGLRLGDPQARISELYPRLTGAPWTDDRTWLWSPEAGTSDPFVGGLTIVTQDSGAGAVVTFIDGGLRCGE